MNQTDLSPMFLDLIRRVCKTPLMFTGLPGFASVANFLDGAHCAICELQPDIEDPAGFRHFQNWLARRYAGYCGGMLNLGWSAYVQSAFPVEAEIYTQLPLLFEESLLVRHVAHTVAGSCVVYYGIRLEVTSEDELAAIDEDEERTLRRISQVGLSSWWIQAPVAGRPDALLIGRQLGVFCAGDAAILGDEALLAIMRQTKLALQELGYAVEPGLLVEWDLFYPEPRREIAPP